MGNVMHRRVIIINSFAACLAASTLLLCAVAGRNSLESVTFGLLLGVLATICFRWWTQPVYHTLYDYFSPLAIFQTLSFIYMGIGNIFAYTYHDSMRSGGNPGADDYYVFVLCISIIGLLLYEFGYRYTVNQLKESDGVYPFAAVNLPGTMGRWVRIQALAWYVIAYWVFIYMSSKYIKGSAVYEDVVDEFDNILSQTGSGLFFVAWTNVSLLLFTTRNKLFRVVYVGSLVSLLPVLFSYQSRTMAIMVTVISCICYIAATPRKELSFRIIAATLFLFPVAYIALTGVKLAIFYDKEVQDVVTPEYGLKSKFDAILRSNVFFDAVSMETDDVYEYARADLYGRLAGLEYPSAILKASFEGDVPYLHGYHNLVAASMAVPRVIWPGKPVADPKYIIDEHFNLWAIDDQLPTVIGSAFADGGIVGVVIGLPLLGVVMCLIQHLIWGLKDNLIIYLGGLGYLIHYETYLVAMPMNWLRLIAIVLIVNLCIGFIRVILYRRRTVMTGFSGTMGKPKRKGGFP